MSTALLPPPTDDDVLADRYGRRRGRRGARLRWTVAAVVAVALIATVGTIVVTRSMDTVRADGVAMRVVDDRSVEISFEVSGPPDRAYVCALEALDEEFGIVGWRIIELPPTTAHARAYRETIRTLAPATTGLVNSCWVA